MRDTKNPVFWATSWLPYWIPIVFLVVAAAQMLMSQANERWVLGIWAVVGLTLCLSAVPRRVTVGAEGMRIAWLGIPRTIRYRDVRRAAPLANGDVEITLHRGTQIRLRPSPFGAKAPREEVLERLWSTVSVGAEERLSESEQALLARSGKPAREWAKSLTGLTRAGAQYRAGIPIERLFRIAANPAIEAEHRAAAATAIAGTIDDATRVRLEEIARTTVDDDVRGALDRIAAARDEEGLAEALADLGKR